jgi:hypothetical protein
MTVVKKTAYAGPPPAPALAPRPSWDRVMRSSADAADTGVRPPGRERRWRVDRRRADRRRVDVGSPYGQDRRSDRDDRQGDRRGAPTARAGIGLTRDYFAHETALVDAPTSTVPAALLVRFRG